jgi:hypothetical protein
MCFLDFLFVGWYSVGFMHPIKINLLLFHKIYLFSHVILGIYVLLDFSRLQPLPLMHISNLILKFRLESFVNFTLVSLLVIVLFGVFSLKHLRTLILPPLHFLVYFFNFYGFSACNFQSLFAVFEFEFAQLQASLTHGFVFFT